MPMEKPLSEKYDFYSMRRRAAQDIAVWVEKGKNKNEILFRLLINYGFGEKFLENVIKLSPLLTEKLKETERKKDNED